MTITDVVLRPPIPLNEETRAVGLDRGASCALSAVPPDMRVITLCFYFSTNAHVMKGQLQNVTDSFPGSVFIRCVNFLFVISLHYILDLKVMDRSVQIKTFSCLFIVYNNNYRLTVTSTNDMVFIRRA